MSDKTTTSPRKSGPGTSRAAAGSPASTGPIAGATHDKELPVGRHPLQLYSLATPNGQKVTIMLEELLALGHAGAEYDAWLINIREGDQFGSGFVAINPNSKIPAMVDRSGPPPIRVFESGAILLYLAEKFGALLPTEPAARAECLSWLFWQMGSAPYLGGGFGHFYAYAPAKFEYAIDRFAMETKRQLDVLDRRLGESRYLAGDDYTIADIAVFPWYGGLVKGACTTPPSSCRCRTTRTCCDGRTSSPRARPSSAGGWSTGRRAIPPGSCASATTRATSTRGRRTSSRAGRHSCSSPGPRASGERRRRDEAAELALDQPREFERRAVLEPGSDDLDADRQTRRACARPASRSPATPAGWRRPATAVGRDRAAARR